MPTGYPNINGREFSGASIEVRAVGRKWYPTSINYGDGLEPGMVEKHGSALPAGWTRGRWAGEDATMEMTTADADEMLAALGDGFGLVVFSVQVTRAEENMNTSRDELPAVRISKVSDPAATGSDASKRSFTLKVLKPIKRGGLQIVNDAPSLS